MGNLNIKVDYDGLYRGRETRLLTGHGFRLVVEKLSSPPGDLVNCSNLEVGSRAKERDALELRYREEEVQRDRRQFIIALNREAESALISNALNTVYCIKNELEYIAVFPFVLMARTSRDDALHQNSMLSCALTMLNPLPLFFLKSGNASSSVLLFGSSTWKVAAIVTQKLQAFGNICLRHVIVIPCSDIIANEELHHRMG